MTSAGDPTEALHLQVDEVEQRMKDATARLDTLTGLHEVLAEVVGTADAADGYVHVEVAGQGVRELTINPRAMKLTSAELADEIKQALTDATADFRTKVTAALEEHGSLPTPEALAATRSEARRDFEQAQRDFTAAMRTAAADISRAAQLRNPR